jgi:hypothetical protein
MRRAAKVDANQAEIVKKIRSIGASVHSVAQLKGFCDIVVGFRGKNFLFEIKDENQPPSKRKLTEMEAKFQLSWQGQIDTIINFDEALEILMRSGI